MIRKLSFIILLLGTLLPDAMARHIKGGWMYYEYLGPSSSDPGKYMYRLNLKLYRDCNPSSPGQNPDQINFTIFRNIDNVMVNNASAPKVNEYSLSKTTFNKCIDPRPNICYIVFEYSTIVELPPTSSGYTVSFQRCCRIDGIVNMQPPSNTEGITYTITIPGTISGVDNPKNTSPLFAEKDTALTCFNSNITLDYSAVDPDGDSLVYSFSPALSGSNQGSPSPTVASPPPYNSVPYGAGYDHTNPFGTNMRIDPRTGIITGQTPSITGEYVLAVSIQEYRNGVFIAETRKELHVFVAGCTLAAATLPPKIISCDDFSVSFENLNASPAIRSYKWDFGVPGISSDTSSSPTPTYVYPDTGTYRASLIVNEFEDCSDTAFTKVIVYPGFKPGFSIFGSCILNPYRFTDTTRSRYGIVNRWTWDLGEPTTLADTSTQRITNYKYPTLGTKFVSLIVEDSKGCMDTVRKTLQVGDKPPLDLAFRDTLICSIDTLRLQAASAGTYVWTPDFRIIDRFTATPSVFPVDTITYYATVTEGGCSNTDSVRVNVLDFISVEAGKDTTICRTDGVQLRPVSQALQYLWTPAATLSNASVKFPVATPTASSTTYYVTANLGKCQDRDSVTVRTIPYPGADAGADTTICYDAVATLRGRAVGSRFQWSPASLLSNAGTLTPTARLIRDASFVLTVFDTLGCPKPGIDTMKVTVLPKLNVFAGNDTTVVLGQPLVFQLKDIPVVTSYRWSPSIALNDPNIHNPTALFLKDMLLPGQDMITYTLTGTTAIGCTESDQVQVKVFNTGPSIFVPSGFTPNGDGKNDVLRPIVVGMKSLDLFSIYNRMGQLVFSTRELNKGWDGRINGELQQSAAFVYMAQATDFNGNVVKRSGTFVLIR